jgi:sugar lactone lactonase YvrE
MVKINTTNGQSVGEYLTTPAGLLRDPSRTTVDQYGNVWVANRADNNTTNGTGSITRIGLVIGGTRYHKNANGTYSPDGSGEYLQGPFTYNTCIDRDGDGYIRTSKGLGNILPWSSTNNWDFNGGVSTAEDETITEYTRVACTGTRTIAVDRYNDVWVGGRLNLRAHQKINGLTGFPVPGTTFYTTNAGGYGGVIDALGNLWSSPGPPRDEYDLGPKMLHFVPPDTNNWKALVTGDAVVDEWMYGIALDPVNPYIWQTSKDCIYRWNTNGTPCTNGNGTLVKYSHHAEAAKGLVVDTNGHIWVSQSGAQSVSHLAADGTWIGNVELKRNSVRGEYFDNPNCSGGPLSIRYDDTVDFNWTNRAPFPSFPTNNFSVRWTGRLVIPESGEYTLCINTDTNDAFRLLFNGEPIIDNWTSPSPNQTEWSTTIQLYETIYDVVLEYADFTGNSQVHLSWIKPNESEKTIISRDDFYGLNIVGDDATGLSIDNAGKIWAINFGTDNAVRIDPNAGNLIITNNHTYHLGEVDMITEFRAGAAPYNYSDMTGFNNRIVNSGMFPLKSYWSVIHDCAVTNLNWNLVSWNATLTNNCTIEVFARANNERLPLARQSFLAITNNVQLINLVGRFIEFRVGMIRDDASKTPTLEDLTLYGTKP